MNCFYIFDESFNLLRDTCQMQWFYWRLSCQLLCVCVGMVGGRLVYRWFGWFGIFSPWLAAAADDPAPLPPHARLENISWKKWQCHEKNWKWFPPMHFHQNSLLCDILVLQIKWIIIKNVNYFLTVRTLPKQLGRGEVGGGMGSLCCIVLH